MKKLEDIITNAASSEAQQVDEHKHLQKIVDSVFDQKNIETKTELNQKQINVITRAEVIATEFDIPLIKAYTKKFMVLMMSKDRKSRKEFTDISKSMISAEHQVDDQSTWNKLIGGK